MIKDCQRCKGQSRHYSVLKDRSGKQSHGCGVLQIVPCDAPACRKGKVTTESMREYYEHIA